MRTWIINKDYESSYREVDAITFKVEGDFIVFRAGDEVRYVIRALEVRTIEPKPSAQ